MYKIRGADQKEYGPLTDDHVRQWIAEGRANSRTQVQPAGSAEWQELGTQLADCAGTLKPARTAQPKERHV